MTCILPLSLKSRSEPYQLITRRGVSLSSISRLFMAQLTPQQDTP